MAKHNLGFFETMYKIRRFEEKLLTLFSEGKLNGTTHTCIGQEANAVGVISNLKNDLDVVYSNHRGHGHFLAFYDNPKGLLFEIMGLPDGVCSGIGGSQHLCFNNFFTNGIQGGIVPVTVGMSLALKKESNQGIGVVFLGDGTLGEGVVYEAFNMASLWNAPTLFVIENNHYAQSTPSNLQVAGSIADRPRAFGIRTTELDTTDVEEIYSASRDIIERIRITSKPECLILNTYRFAPHSKGDDFRDPEEIKERRKKDPLIVFENSYPNIEEIESIKSKVDNQIDNLASEGLQIKEK